MRTGSETRARAADKLMARHPVDYARRERLFGEALAKMQLLITTHIKCSQRPSAVEDRTVESRTKRLADTTLDGAVPAGSDAHRNPASGEPTSTCELRAATHPRKGGGGLRYERVDC
jgi:hypothetical protein